LDYEGVSYSQKSSSKLKRKFESVEYENETDDDDDEELDDDLPNPVRLGRPTGSQDQYINWELPNGKLVPIPPRYELVTKYEIKKLRNFEREQRLKSFVTQPEAITTMRNSTSNYQWPPPE